MRKVQVGDILVGKLSSSVNGNGYFSHPDLEKDLLVYKLNTNKALHLDTVKVELILVRNRIEAKVIEVVERFKTEYVGTMQVDDKYAFFIPDSPKISTDFFVPSKHRMNVKNGQKVVAEMYNWKGRIPNARIIKILGDAGEHQTEMHSIMEEYGLPYVFPNEVLEEAEFIDGTITQEEIEKRKDLRHLTIVGIDPYDSKDADDTIGLEWENGLAVVSVNIADVSHYVKHNSLLDREAYSRGNSVYLVDRCVPMLPEVLSNNICSLKSGSDKLCFSAIFKIDNKGKILERWFGKTIINVDRDYSYEEAQEVIENGVREDHRATDQVILELNRIAKRLRKERASDEFLQIDSPEVKFKLDENNKPIDIIFKLSKDSNKLIEEFMLLANREVAKYVKSKGLLCINRVHEVPDISKLMALKEFVKQFDYDLKLSDESEIRSSLNGLLEQTRDTPESDIINKLVTRAQQKAIYSTKNLGHYGLNFRDYSHFTSPIRRYSDLILHRILTQAIGNDGYNQHENN